MGGIIWIIVVGFVAGLIARWLAPGPKNPSGFILTTVLGIVGAFLATWVGQAIGRRPRTVWVVTAILLGVGALGLVGFKFGPLTVAQSFRGTQPSITAQNVVAEHFPAGSG